jgi:hypothetical protein
MYYICVLDTMYYICVLDTMYYVCVCTGYHVLYLCTRYHVLCLCVYVIPCTMSLSVYWIPCTITIVVYLQDFQLSIKCFFNVQGGKEVNAQVTSRDGMSVVIACGTVHFSYPGDTPNVNVPFQINWGDNQPLDNPSAIQGEFTTTPVSFRMSLQQPQRHSE